jgi:hypothetical protein
MITLCLVSSGCGASPTGPDQRIPPTTGKPASLQVTDWNFNFGLGVTTMHVEATWGIGLYSASRDVTAEAMWKTNDPKVVRVVQPGRLASVSPGDATVTVVFRDVRIDRRLQVFSGESPLWVIDDGAAGSSVTDATNFDPNNGVEGATVEITAGHNTGRTAITDKAGFYTFLPPFVCGPLTARATKEGYEDAVASSFMCLEGMPHLKLTPIQ